MKPLDTLEALEEYFNLYLNGEIATPPSDKALTVYQTLYIQESKRQAGLKVQKVRLQKQEKPILEEPREMKSYSDLLDRVITKKNRS